MGISFCCFCVREGRNTQAFERNDPGTSDEIGVHVPKFKGFTKSSDRNEENGQTIKDENKYGICFKSKPFIGSQSLNYELSLEGDLSHTHKGCSNAIPQAASAFLPLLVYALLLRIQKIVHLCRNRSR